MNNIKEVLSKKDTLFCSFATPWLSDVIRQAISWLAFPQMQYWSHTQLMTSFINRCSNILYEALRRRYKANQ